MHSGSQERGTITVTADGQLRRSMSVAPPTKTHYPTQYNSRAAPGQLPANPPKLKSQGEHTDTVTDGGIVVGSTPSSVTPGTPRQPPDRQSNSGGRYGPARRRRNATADLSAASTQASHIPGASSRGSTSARIALSANLLAGADQPQIAEPAKG
jgi:hypothetical protein